MSAEGVSTFLTVRRKYIDLEILPIRASIWHLKFIKGSIKTPRNLMAGVSDSEVTRLSGQIKFGLGGALLLLKLRFIFTSLERTTLLFVNKINFVFSGCSASLCDLKKSVTFLSSTLTFTIRSSKFSPASSSVVSSANNKARSSEQRGRSLI